MRIVGSANLVVQKLGLVETNRPQNHEKVKLHSDEQRKKAIEASFEVLDDALERMSRNQTLVPEHLDSISEAASNHLTRAEKAIKDSQLDVAERSLREAYVELQKIASVRGAVADMISGYDLSY